MVNLVIIISILQVKKTGKEKLRMWPPGHIACQRWNQTSLTLDNAFHVDANSLLHLQVSHAFQPAGKVAPGS